MASAAEGAEAKHGIAAALAGSVENISDNGSVTFTRYVRLVLPLDGYVFWVKADLITQSALLNSMRFNAARFNEARLIAAPAATITVEGSFHYATRQEQNEAEMQGVNTCTFTALAPIQAFNTIAPNELYIAEYPGDVNNFEAPITFAFSQRANYYEPADLYHYYGTAVLPVMKAQLIDSVDTLARRPLIVSNSLPMWLALGDYVPTSPNIGIANTIPLYPSFLVPGNLPPPYGAVHIYDTETLQSAPRLGPKLGHHALCHDRVRVTLYGCDNEAAMMFLDAVNDYSFNYDKIGIMNMPVPRDEKMTQAELGVIAQKKVIEYDVSYYQNQSRDVARQLIKRAIVTVLPLPFESALPQVNPGEL